MDFPNAQLPSLIPLKNSSAQSNIDTENELRNLFVQLFNDFLSSDTFDANVLGMMHLGSLDLVRKAVNKDGLVLLAGTREETATRYLYRAWQSKNNQGRGLHFLRTYLQLLFPNASQVEQMAQDKDYPYPTKLIPLTVANSGYYSTSRIRVLIDHQKVTTQQLERMTPILRSVIAARLLLEIGTFSQQHKANYISIVAISGSKSIVYPMQSTGTSQSKSLFIAIAVRTITTSTVYPS